MSKKHQFLVVDIETTKDELERDIPYDVGVAVCDRNGEISYQGSFIVQEVFFRQDLMLKAYYSNKIQQYHQKLADGNSQMIPFNSLRNLLLNIKDVYACKAFCAYNAAFDNRGLNNLMKFMDIDETFFPMDFPIYDIWAMACQTFMKRRKYLKFCIENQLYRLETGNIKTSAETAYAYIIGDPTFEEEHTGLADVLIECQIMAYALKCKDKIDRGIIPQPWRIPNNCAETMGIKPEPVTPMNFSDLPQPRTQKELIEAMNFLLDEEK